MTVDVPKVNLTWIDEHDRRHADSAYVNGPTAEEIQDEVDAHRRAGIELAREFLAAGRPGRAFYELVRSVERQARVAGVAIYPLPLAPMNRLPMLRQVGGEHRG